MPSGEPSREVKGVLVCEWTSKDSDAGPGWTLAPHPDAPGLATHKQQTSKRCWSRADTLTHLAQTHLIAQPQAATLQQLLEQGPAGQEPSQSQQQFPAALRAILGELRQRPSPRVTLGAQYGLHQADLGLCKQRTGKSNLWDHPWEVSPPSHLPGVSRRKVKPRRCAGSGLGC